MSDVTHDRLRRTATLRGERHDRWQRALIAVIGCGVLGSRLALEAVLSGTSVLLVDPATARPVNRGTQNLLAGKSKVESVVEQCDRIAPGRVEGHVTDVRHVAVRLLGECDALIDASDDPGLVLPLTEISNGLGKPLLRVALDGSGELEMGRVLASHGGGGNSCQICTYSLKRLAGAAPRTPCPWRSPAGGSGEGQTPGWRSPPTLAGGALASTLTGVALLQCQRLVAGDPELVLDREIIVDLSHFQIIDAELRRSSACLSGHVSWDLVELSCRAEETCLADLYALARRELGAGNVTLEPYLHPLCLEAECRCGARRAITGTVWANAPRCSTCGTAMSWIGPVKLARFSEDQARKLGILSTSLARLGLPREGAMVIARAEGVATLRFLLARQKGCEMDKQGKPR